MSTQHAPKNLDNSTAHPRLKPVVLQPFVRERDLLRLHPLERRVHLPGRLPLALVLLPALGLWRRALAVTVRGRVDCDGGRHGRTVFVRSPPLRHRDLFLRDFSSLGSSCLGFRLFGFDLRGFV